MGTGEGGARGPGQAARPYVAGEAYSIADITAMAAVDFAGWMRLLPTCEHPYLDAWWTALRARPSYTA
ncbi:MAG: hypothetical protein IM669_07785 [Phenylobacterium sp.]|uniref:glutathione binding-like protein n=1 Tax=Phenylobacterium sp. TaxID=1871053 RepID=UPI00345B2698|nr:hypothetical protein [Phenylobacterium sp.]MCA3757409.1 hypothetical protein [Phenylobacterium sp.]